MNILSNPFRAIGLENAALSDVPRPAADAKQALDLIARCPRAAPTALRTAEELARSLGLGGVYIKDERSRMNMGSFKALGAAYVIAHDAENGQAAGRTYVTASAGNHGLSVAAGAAAFGGHSRVYIAETVPEAFAERLRAHGAEVVREGAVYEASMAAAANAATREGLYLLSDSSWSGYTDIPHRVMEGYLVLMAETVAQMPAEPTHVLLQAGVGGLAGACAAHVRLAWGDGPTIVVVEPEAAPALAASIIAAGPVVAPGPVSAMGRLDCKEPSLIALKGLAHDADAFMTITEAEGQAGAERAEAEGFASTPSGAAGLAGLLAGAEALGLDAASQVLLILSEETDN